MKCTRRVRRYSGGSDDLPRRGMEVMKSRFCRSYQRVEISHPFPSRISLVVLPDRISS